MTAPDSYVQAVVQRAAGTELRLFHHLRHSSTEWDANEGSIQHRPTLQNCSLLSPEGKRAELKGKLQTRTSGAQRAKSSQCRSCRGSPHWQLWRPARLRGSSSLAPSLPSREPGAGEADLPGRGPMSRCRQLGPRREPC